MFDVDSALSTVSGLRALATYILRRLFTTRGGLIGAPTYGYNLLTLIGSATPPNVVEHKVVEQCLAEEEVEDARATVTFEAGDILRVQIEVESSEGPFSLTVVASQLTASLFLDGVLFEETDLAETA